jgi:hypothetical protein
VALLRVTVKDRDERKVGRAFADRAVELALTSIPGFFGISGAPGPGQPFGVYWPATIPAELVPQEVVVLDQGTTVVDNTVGPFDPVDVDPPPLDLPPAPGGPTRRAPLGLVVGARSGDKGGNANLGVFTRSAAAFAWLREHLTVERFRELVPEARDLPVERYELANLWSLNFVVVGLLEEGVAASTRQDAQAKGFGEYLRDRWTEIPESLLPS